MEKGVPYRRGYLLYGPPGTGKTSFTQAIAGLCKLNLCYLNLSDSDMSDDMLNRFLSEAPERSIILLEDVDAMFVQRDGLKRGKLSFSGFLNALDGVRSQEGQIMFMTTNHKERLDPALLRPGRADVHVKLDNASEKQIRGIFERFFPNQTALTDKFVTSVPVGRLSMAKLQSHLLIYRDSAEECANNAGELIKEDLNAIQRDMTIEEWLNRLNLIQLKKHFLEHKIRRVEDLSHINDEGLLMDYNLCDGNTLHQRRLWRILIGDDEFKENFKYLSKHAIRNIGQTFLENQRDVEDLANQVPENTITGF